MQAGDQDHFVVGAIEDDDLAAFRQIAGRPPQEVVLQPTSAGRQTYKRIVSGYRDRLVALVER